MVVLFRFTHNTSLELDSAAFLLFLDELRDQLSALSVFRNIQTTFLLDARLLNAVSRGLSIPTSKLARMHRVVGLVCHSLPQTRELVLLAHAIHRASRRYIRRSCLLLLD